VSGRVPILGSAEMESFLFYKLEYAPAEEPESWRAVSTIIDSTARHALLDTWDTTVLPDGVYRLKLTMVDQTSQEPCRVIVNGLTVANNTIATPTATVTSPAVTVADVGSSAPTSAPPGAGVGSASATPPDEAGGAAPGASGSDATAPGAEPPAEAAATATAAGAEPPERATARPVTPTATAGADEPAARGTATAGAGADVGGTGSEGGSSELASAGAADRAADVAGSSDDQGDAGAGAGEASDDSFTDRPSEPEPPEASGLFPRPSTLAETIGLSSWPKAFCGGVAAMALLMLFATAVLALRRSP
jgi:hypothetical protein